MCKWLQRTNLTTRSKDAKEVTKQGKSSNQSKKSNTKNECTSIYATENSGAISKRTENPCCVTDWWNDHKK